MENPGNQVARSVLGLSQLNTPRLYHPAFVPAPETGLAEGVIAVRGIIPTLLAAERAREYALSYRNFRVGAAALALFRDGYVQQQAFLHGANIKPIAGDETINIHAEHTVISGIEQLRGASDVRVPVLAIIGDIQPDQQSGRETKTLHPCGVCRDNFASEDSVISNETLIVTANPALTTLEFFTVDALKKFHTDGDDSKIFSADFSKRLELLTPIDTSSNAFRGVIDVAALDTPEIQREEEVFRASVEVTALALVMDQVTKAA